MRHIFEEALSKLDELEKSLTEQYEKKRIEKPDVVQRETISSSKSPAEVDDSKGWRLLEFLLLSRVFKLCIILLHLTFRCFAHILKLFQQGTFTPFISIS